MLVGKKKKKKKMMMMMKMKMMKKMMMKMKMKKMMKMMKKMKMKKKKKKNHESPTQMKRLHFFHFSQTKRMVKHLLQLQPVVEMLHWVLDEVMRKRMKRKYL